MIDHGTFLTRTVNGASGKTMQVEDATYFYDGYGITGEQGDLIQLEGQSASARIVHIDHQTHTLTLDTTLTWNQSTGVALTFSGTAPDLGAYEL